MGLRFIQGSEAGCDNDLCVLFCSTAEIAFGPVIRASDNGQRDAHEEAEAFLKWCEESGRESRDLRSVSVGRVVDLFDDYRKESTARDEKADDEYQKARELPGTIRRSKP